MVDTHQLPWLGYGMLPPPLAHPLPSGDMQVMFAQAQHHVLTQAALAQQAQEQEAESLLAKASQSASLFPQHPGVSALPPGMMLRLAAAGIGLPEERQGTSKANVGRNAMPAKRTNQCNHTSLRSYLEEELRYVDKRCIFTCRRINKLGFRSKEFLEQHFSKFGEVQEVFVTHPRSKPDVSGAPPKTRPGNFSIVVMKSPETVQRILACGSDQMVRNVQIRVSMFESKGENRSEGVSTEPSTSMHGSGSQNGSDEIDGEGDALAACAPLQDPRKIRAARGLQSSAQRVAPGLQSSAQLAAPGLQSPASEDWALRLRQEADRLRAEADTMLALAEVTAGSFPTLPPSSKVAAAPSLIASPAPGLSPNLLENHMYAHTEPSPPWPTIAMLPTSSACMPGAWEGESALVDGQMIESASADPSCSGTLSAHLMEVSTEDPACVFVVRQIHKLGFQSRDVLWQHYSQYGKVQRVLVADKRVKAFPGANGQRKTRPGGLGLIVMQSADVVREILAMGGEHVILGHSIIIQPYEGPKTNAFIANDHEASTRAPSSNAAPSSMASSSRTASSGASSQGFESRQTSLESNSSHPKVKDVPGF